MLRVLKLFSRNYISYHILERGAMKQNMYKRATQNSFSH
jgi:hypothetical protein